MRVIKSYLKFFVKRIVRLLRTLFLSFVGGDVNKDSWANRILLINLEALGDLVVFTSVLKHYKKVFPEKRIYLALKSGLGLTNLYKGVFADEIITLDYRKFAINPFYGVSFVNRLRRIGFETVINHDFSVAEIMGKSIAAELGAKNIIGYEGLGVEYAHPFDIQQRKNIAIVKKKIFPRYTKVIPSVDKETARRGELKNAVSHYAAIFEAATGVSVTDYSTVLPHDFCDPSFLDRFGIRGVKYAILNVNASVPYKRWPLDRFVKIAEFLDSRGIKIVLAGARKERPLAERFQKMTGVPMINLTGETDLEEFICLVYRSFMVLTNDTSLVHIAVALRKPSVSITGGGQFGMFSDYGYQGLNRWVYEKHSCFGDNWQCGKKTKSGPAPCLELIASNKVINTASSLIRYLESDGREKVGVQDFKIRFPEDSNE